MMVSLPDNHPLLDAAWFCTEFAGPLGQQAIPEFVSAGLKAGAAAPLSANDAVRSAVRDLLRWGGYKPTGRGKPASEYLLKAVTEGLLGSINVAVDICNLVSFHSGLPISVVDLSRGEAPYRVEVAASGVKYVFNASGQEIDVAGLICLFDAEGPCANAVKDAQRTKTHGETTKTLSVVWGTKSLPGRTHATAAWYRECIEKTGAKVFDVGPLGG